MAKKKGNFQLNRYYLSPIIDLLSFRDRALFLVVTVITLILSFLDLLGVLLIGVLGSLSLTAISEGPVGNRVLALLKSVGLESFDLEYQIVVIGISAAVFLLLKTLLSLTLARHTLFFMARRSASVSSDLTKRYFSLPIGKINSKSAQSSIYALTQGVDKIMVGVIGMGVSLVSELALLIVMSIGLYLVDTQTAIMTSCAFGLTSFFLYRLTRGKTVKLAERQGLLKIENAQLISDTIIAYKELLVRNRRSFYAQKISDLRMEIATGSAKLKFLSAIYKYILEIVFVLIFVMLTVFQFSTGTAVRAIATLTIFVAASVRIIPAILRLQQGVVEIKSSLAQAGPTLDLIRELSGIIAESFNDKGVNRDHAEFTASIEISRINFSYKESTKVLNEINIKVSPGEFIAIIGPSGAGKTTLLDVLLGTLEPQTGDVLISGMSPKDTFVTWPGAVSYVPQDCPVIRGTIRENLGLGFLTSDIPDEYCWESLKFAHLDDFVKSLPRQLETEVGDRGSQLSGGQRQRLGLARALMTRPKLLILDEATSSLDIETEMRINDSIKSLTNQVTLVVVAHRLSTVTNAKHVYLIEEGAIKGEGSFQELMTRFPKLVNQAKILGS